MVHFDTLDYIENIKNLPLHIKVEANNFIEFLMKKEEKEIKKPIFGSAKGKIIMKDDFEEPLEDFKNYMPK
jgi:hypothetical protein